MFDDDSSTSSIAGLQSVSMTTTESESDDIGFDNCESDYGFDKRGDTDLRPVHSKNLLVQQAPTGEDNTNDTDDSDSAGSQPFRGFQPVLSGIVGNKKDDNFKKFRIDGPFHKLVLLCMLPSWDKVITPIHLHINSLRWASFRSICDAACFVHSHLPKTSSILLDGSKQAEAAHFCITQLRSSTPNTWNILPELLADSLSHASRSPKVINSIRGFLRRRNGKFKGLPSNTWRAMTDYLSRYHMNIPRPPNTSQAPRAQQPSTLTQIHQPLPATLTPAQRPPSTSKIQKSAAVSQDPFPPLDSLSTTPQGPSDTSQDPQNTPSKLPELTDSLSHTGRSPKVMDRIRGFLRRRNGKFKGLPSNTGGQ